MEDKPKRRHKAIPTLVVIVTLLVVWQLVAWLVGNDIILVTPGRVGVKLVELVPQPSFWSRIAYSLLRIGCGFALAFVLGLTTAWLAGINRWVAAYVGTIMRLIRSIPVVCFIILLLIWTDSTYLGLSVSFLMVLPVVYANTEEGFANRDLKLDEMATVFGFSQPRRWWTISLPRLMPYLVAACQVGFGLAWKAGISAEVIGMPTGSIGERLYQAKVFLATADLFAWTTVIVTLSFICEKLALWGLKRIQVQLKRYGS